MEYLWSFLEEWNSKFISYSDMKFEEALEEVSKNLKDTENYLNDITGYEPLALPDTLWFGILDLTQTLITQKSTLMATHGLCYYLAIESLNKATSDFVKFKAIEILINLYDNHNKLFSIVEINFDETDF